MGVSVHGPVRMTIANGQTDSPALSTLLTAGQMKTLAAGIVQILIQAPAALTGAVTVQTTNTEGSATWNTHQESGADLTVGAGKNVPLNSGPFRDLRLHSAAAEGAQRDFDLSFQLRFD